MTRKEQLLYLLRAYYHGEYDTSVFCELFVETYSDGVDDPGMSRQEKTCMEEFCRLAERFSSYEDDLEMSSFFVDERTFKESFGPLYEKYCHVINGATIKIILEADCRRDLCIKVDNKEYQQYLDEPLEIAMDSNEVTIEIFTLKDRKYDFWGMFGLIFSRLIFFPIYLLQSYGVDAWENNADPFVIRATYTTKEHEVKLRYIPSKYDEGHETFIPPELLVNGEKVPVEMQPDIENVKKAFIKECTSWKWFMMLMIAIMILVILQKNLFASVITVITIGGLLIAAGIRMHKEYLCMKKIISEQIFEKPLDK